MKSKKMDYIKPTISAIEVVLRQVINNGSPSSGDDSGGDSGGGSGEWDGIDLPPVGDGGSVW